MNPRLKWGGSTLLLAGVVAAVLAATSGGPALSCSGATVTPSTLATRAFTAAEGDVLCLGSGAYGEFPGTNTGKPLTITAAEGASPVIAFILQDVDDSNLTIDGDRDAWNDTTGINIPYMLLTGYNSNLANITVRDTLFQETGPVGAGQIKIDGTHNEGPYLIEHNRFTAADSGTEAAIRSDSPLVVAAITENLFHDMYADGIKINLGHLTITNNKFLNISDHSPRNPSADLHTDVIQFNGGVGDLRGNWADTCEQGYTAFDGGTAESVLAHNIMQNCGGHSISLFFDNDGDGSDVSYNTVLPYGPPLLCGTPPVKNSQYPGVDPSKTSLWDNVLGTGLDISSQGSGGVACAPSRNENNMLPSSASGANFNGSAQFVGGADADDFDSFADFCLDPASPGYDDATDDGQVGVCGGDYDADSDGPPTDEGY